MDVGQVSIPALAEGPQQVQRGGRLRIGLHQPLRIGDARFGGEIHAVDVVAPVGWQRDPINGFDGFRARLGELARYAAHFDDRFGRREGQHDRHLQDDAERVADIVRVELLEALGAIAALKQECLARSNLCEALFQAPRFAGKYERWIAFQARLNCSKGCSVGIVRRDVLGRQFPPI